METNGGAEKVIETIITSSKHNNDALFCYSKNQIFSLKKSKIVGFNTTFTISSSPFSLKLLIEQRIADASTKPKNLGRQFENAKPMFKAKNITFGDIHDTNGEIIYFKNK